MEKQVLYVRVNQDMTAKLVLDSPVEIGEISKKLETISKVNNLGSSVTPME
ncbi:hypothetical protein KY343_03680 [Candidatus Woesearchaeota archaeon]|nr:hypothetical protein [Candidatus Woesearchaeota archaeon]